MENNITIRFNLNNTDFEIDFTNVNDTVDFIKSLCVNNKIGGVKTLDRDRVEDRDVIAIIFKD